jgi:thiol-disulfide isomerase/thioredoxin
MNDLARSFFCLFLTVFSLSLSSFGVNNSVNDVQRFIQKNPDSVILFYRPGCPYCQYVRPLFDAVSQKYRDRADSVVFLSVDVSSDPQGFKKSFGFSTVPTFIYTKDGAEQAQHRHGSDNKRLRQSDIETIIKKLYV